MTPRTTPSQAQRNSQFPRSCQFAIDSKNDGIQAKYAMITLNTKRKYEKFTLSFTLADYEELDHFKSCFAEDGKEIYKDL